LRPAINADNAHQNNCTSSLHLTAILDTQHVTISGRPDILQRFSSSISITKSCSIHPTTVDALYHAHTLHNVHAQVLADVGRHLIHFPDFSDLKYPVFSTVTGKPLAPGSGHSSLVDAVLDMILVSPVDWVSVVQGIGSAVPDDAPTQVLNFGPSSGLLRMLEKSLSVQKVTCTDVTICDCGNSVDHTGEQKFKQEPIAIVGMALRLPGGARTANELWELLERGINTVSEVCWFRVLWNFTC
jgi:acyl transferase domain-containing protein